MNDAQLDEFVRGLRVAMDRSGWKAAPLSEASGLGTTAVRDLFRKNSSPKVSTAKALADTLGFSVDEIISLGSGEPYTPSSTISAVGIVGAGAPVPLTDEAEKTGGMYQIAAPVQLLRRGPASTFAAVEVEGTSMVPVYEPGDVLFFSRTTHEGVPDQDIGHACIVADVDGMVWVKHIKRGTAPGLFHLLSINPDGENMHDRPIRWASRVIMALPGDMVEKVDVPQRANVRR